MKKLKFITCICIFALVAGIIVISSCSKQETGVTQNETCITQADKAFVSKIVNFKQKVKYLRENPDFKSGESMEADSVIWYMETLFNATYSFADEHYQKTKVDTATVQIDIDENNEASLDDMASTFDEIINIVTQFYYACEFSQKGFLLLDLREAETTNNKLIISLRSVIGEKDGDWNPFGPDDDWWFGELRGKCDWSNPGTDAAEKIQEAININKPLVSPPPGYRFIYSDYEQIELFGHEYENNNGEKLIFYIENENGNFTINDKCIVPNEMNFYFFGEQEVIYNILPIDYNKPSNWIFMECDIDGLQEDNPNSGYIPSIHHNNELTYALRHMIAGEILDPPVEL